MIINDGSQHSSVSALRGNSNAALAQTMNRLSETFKMKGLNPIKDIDKILSTKEYLDEYYNILLGDYSDNHLNLSEGADLELGTALHDEGYTNLMKLMENTREMVLSESQQTGSLLPIVGLSMPLMKLYWIKNVYKDLIPVQVAKEQTVKVGVEREYLQDPKTKKKYYLPESFADYGMELFAPARQKLSTDPITVPSLQFDLITAAGGSIAQDDTISRQFFITELVYETLKADGVTKEDKTLANLRIRVDQGTRMFRYEVKEASEVAGETVIKTVDILTGDVDYEMGMFNVSSTMGKIKTVKVDGYLSTENHLRTMSSGWDKEVVEFTIPDGEHLATSLTAERIKDEKAIYNIDSQAKIVGQMTNNLGVLKDMKVQAFLDASKERIKGTNLYRTASFDCKPPAGIYMAPEDWMSRGIRRTLDNLALALNKILYNENVTLVVIGAQETVKLIDDVQWMYGKESEVGGCKLGYSIGLYNNMRSFMIASSDRFKGEGLQILVIPTTDEQMTYKMFEWQFCISNEYRTGDNVRVPSVMAFERYLIDEFIPIQGDLDIINNKMSISDLYA